jgi:hypothetical protein
MILDIIGWLGMGLIILAYFLNITKRLSCTSRLYLLINIVGSILLGLGLIEKQAWSGVALQLVWIIISIYGMLPLKKLP